MKSYKFKINDNEYAVDINSTEGNFVNLEVNGTAYRIEMEKEVKKSKTPTLARKPRAAAPLKPRMTASGVKKVEAPLPGIILSIDVKEGDSVKMGDRLMVMEAMKMENSILAEASGTVKSIKIEANQNVLQGDILLEIE